MRIGQAHVSDRRRLALEGEESVAIGLRPSWDSTTRSRVVRLAAPGQPLQPPRPHLMVSMPAAGPPSYKCSSDTVRRSRSMPARSRHRLGAELEPTSQERPKGHGNPRYPLSYFELSWTLLDSLRSPRHRERRLPQRRREAWHCLPLTKACFPRSYRQQAPPVGWRGEDSPLCGDRLVGHAPMGQEYGPFVAGRAS